MGTVLISVTTSVKQITFLFRGARVEAGVGVVARVDAAGSRDDAE